MEHRHYLSPLFDPASVLLIVGDDPQPHWATAVQYALGSGGASHETVHLSTGSPTPPPTRRFELAVLAVAPPQVPAALVVAAAAQASAAVLLCENCDTAQTSQWLEFARRAGIRLLGPHSYGFARPPRRLSVGLAGPMPHAGNVAMVSQSSALAGAVLDWAVDNPTGFSLVVTLGAEADVDIAQVLDYLANDPATRAVVVYLEAVRDARTFLSALRALATVKPVVVLKGHRDERAPRKALTHSGALGGADAIYAAALRRAGAVQIRLFAQVFTAARWLAARASPIGNRLAVVSNGAGSAVLACDQASYNGVRIARLSSDTLRGLGDALERAPDGNPLNLGRDADGEGYVQALQAMAADPAVDALLAIVTPHAALDVDAIAARLVAIHPTLSKPLFACLMGERAVHEPARRIDASGIPVFSTPEAAVDAYASLASFHANQALLQQVPRPLSGLAAPDLDAARRVVTAANDCGRPILTEVESKALLEAFHVPVTPTRLAADIGQAIAIADDIGYPVVLKVSSPDIPHKSDVGGVVLDVRNRTELRTQYTQMMTRVRRSAPGARLEGISVQPMRRGRHDRELYVGVVRDPLWGPVIAFGAGGTRIEVMRDSSLEFPPLNRFLARRMIERTRVYETLRAFRGAPAIDFEALEAVLVRVSEMVCEMPEIVEMDINPLFADERGLQAVDARIVVERARVRGDRYDHMAILPYPSHLVTECVSSDGRPYTLRPIQPEDGENLQRFVRGLSEQTRYYRFISAISELTPRMLARYTQIDYDREVALVATVPEPDDPSPGRRGERIIGVVRYLLNPDRDTGEYAVVIADDWQGRGLGSRLMRTIVDVAARRGMRQLIGYVLGNNRPMLTMMQRLGFRVATDPDDPAMRLVIRDLVPAAAPSEAASAAPPVVRA